MPVIILPSNQLSNFAPVLSPSAHVQVRAYIQETTSLCEPQNIHICDGSETENSFLLRLMVQQGTIQALPKYDNWWVGGGWGQQFQVRPPYKQTALCCWLQKCNTLPLHWVLIWCDWWYATQVLRLHQILWNCLRNDLFNMGVRLGLPQQGENTGW